MYIVIVPDIVLSRAKSCQKQKKAISNYHKNQFVQVQYLYRKFENKKIVF